MTDGLDETILLPVALLTPLDPHDRIDPIEVARGSSLVIGRGVEVDRRIRHESISRIHCRLTNEGHRLRVVDLGSCHGTTIDDRPVDEGLIEAGGTLGLGPIRLTLAFVPRPRLPAALPDDGPVDDSMLMDTGRFRRIHDSLVVDLDEDLEAIPNDGACRHCGRRLSRADVLGNRALFDGDALECCACLARPGTELDRIDRFVLYRHLGSGGMGDVYEAVQIPMERAVALKMLDPLSAAEPEAREAFFREARLGGRLRHPNIVHFLDVGEEEGRCFLAMEYVRGRNLAEVLERHGRLPVADAVLIAIQVARALDHATRFGIVHRDVKPSNILLGLDGTIQLADFGLAKELLASARSPEEDAIGTPAYMPPERHARADAADHRSDIYALGLTLHVMTTGVHPFDREDAAGTMRAILEEGVPPTGDVAGSAAPALDGLIARATARSPDERHPTTEALLADLLRLRNRLRRAQG